MHIEKVSDQCNWIQLLSLEDTVKIENAWISNENDAGRGSDCEARWVSKTRHPDEI